MRSSPTELPTTRPRRLWIVLLPACGLALYPLLAVLAANMGVVPMDGMDVTRAVLSTLVLVAVLRAVVRPIVGSDVGGAIWLGCLLLLLGLYGSVARVSFAWTGIGREDWRLAIGHAVASVLAATVIMRVSERRQIDPGGFAVVATAILGFNAVTIASRAPHPLSRWDAGAPALATPASRPAGPASREIYYIILDGLGRPDVLRDAYGLDVSPFVTFLRSRGFYVADRARSNYAQTFLSIASTLNLDHLDGMVASLGSDSRDRRPLQRVIQSNALLRLARRAGYDIVTITSDYAATMHFDGADACRCEQYGLSDIEQAALASTPLAALPLDRWTHEAHRRKVLDAFDALERPLDRHRPAFTFAHIVSPHPPFLFGADGSWRRPAETLLGFRDGDHFPGSAREYVDGYRDQTRYVLQRLTSIVERLLARPGPKPAIVIHGDHGPGSMLHWERPRDTDMEERMGIFAAYYLPGEGPALYPGISPVNGARALATRYLDVNLPFLPERSRFSTWSRPYDFLLVASDVPPAPAAAP